MNKAAYKYLSKLNKLYPWEKNNFVLECMNSCTTPEQMETIWEWGERKYLMFSYSEENRNAYYTKMQEIDMRRYREKK